MVVPLTARFVAATAGTLLVLAGASSVIRTLIVPRPTTSWLTGGVDRMVDGGYRLATAGINEYKRRDRVLATEAAAILVVQLAVWLGIFYVGFSLLMWPFVHGGITQAFNTAGPALWEIGSVNVGGAAQRTILDLASLIGIVTVTLQIAYLPTLYSAFNRRETEVALLNARGGAPSWGPALGAHALRTGNGHVDHRQPARSVRNLGALGRRRGREPHRLSAPGAVPLAPAAVVVGYLVAGGARLRRPVSGALPRRGAGCPGAVVPAERFPVLSRCCPCHGHRRPRGDRPQWQYHAHLR